MYGAVANAQQRYKQQGVLTANPVELVVMLYDGCIKQLKMASLAIEANQIEKSNTCLQKAQRIVVELVNSLDLSYPLAQDLMSLYEFLINEIFMINAEKDGGRITGIVIILEDLRDAWRMVAKEGQGNSVYTDGE